MTEMNPKKKTISLNGTWRMYWCDIGAGNPENLSDLPSLLYDVPGDVHTPFIKAGLISEPLYGMNNQDCRWIEEKEFWCETSFHLKWHEQAPTMLLTLHGLDCTADVYLNGQKVGRHNNAFVEAEWDVAGFLHSGENKLLVRIDQGLRDAQTHDLARMGMMWNNEQPWRAWMRKPQFVYGWDWTIWLASCGIWRDVTLTAVHRCAILDVYARTEDGDLAEGKPCTVRVTAETMMQASEIEMKASSLNCGIYDKDGAKVATCHQRLSGGVQKMELTIMQPRLWWCNGMGEPYLYTLILTIVDADENVLDCYEQKLGLRSIALTEPVLGEEESGFTFVLNGEPVFCKGANHVPCDCLPGRITPKKERTLVALARDEHMNMLRVWGGGVYSSEAFMDACDEMGIMVWHDFMYACGYHPDHDPGFMENITDEARRAIRRLRRHTSLIGWAGNNEIQEMYHAQQQYISGLPFYGQSIYEELLPSLVKEMCPGLVYRPSSPFGGEHQADCRRGDQHIWVLTHVDTHPHYLDLWRFTEFRVKFFSEFGLMGAMTLETAQSCIPEENLHPDDPVWLHHTNSCQDHTLLDRMKRLYFGSEKLTPQQYILRSQAIQSEITRHIYEEFRRQKFFCSGLLFWTLGDSYGVHNWSLIDYGLRRKPIYHALKQAMAPLALCVKGWDVQNDEGMVQWRNHWQNEPGKLEIWGMNDTLADEEAQLEWTVLTLEGKTLLSGTEQVKLAANASHPLGETALEGVAFDPAKTVFRARLVQDGCIVNETKYFFAPFAEMVATNASADVTSRQIGENRYEVTLKADRFIWMAHLCEPDGTVYSENDFDLWPGEERRLTVTTDEPGFAPVLTWMKKQ